MLRVEVSILLFRVSLESRDLLDPLASVDPLDPLDPLDSMVPLESPVVRYEASASSTFTLTDLRRSHCLCRMTSLACNQPAVVFNSIHFFLAGIKWS